MARGPNVFSPEYSNADIPADCEETAVVNIGSLRAIAEHELELMRSWRNAPSVRENMYTRHEISKEEHLSWWGRIRSREDQCYLMYELAGEPMGIVAFTNVDKESSNSFWAFYAAPNAPMGTGSKMEFLALDYAFVELSLYKLQCEVLAFNKPVIKLHQKFGFKVEGVFRAQHKVDEEFIDIYRLGLLASEWSEHRGQMEAKLSAFCRG
jgi:UDP-4-amino-4,6-dideoxy-N-acetyl-beta-L-altrosamine N-acetyltransferase